MLITLCYIYHNFDLMLFNVAVLFSLLLQELIYKEGLITKKSHSFLLCLIGSHTTVFL